MFESLLTLYVPSQPAPSSPSRARRRSEPSSARLRSSSRSSTRPSMLSCELRLFCLPSFHDTEPFDPTAALPRAGRHLPPHRRTTTPLGVPLLPFLDLSPVAQPILPSFPSFLLALHPLQTQLEVITKATFAARRRLTSPPSTDAPLPAVPISTSTPPQATSTPTSSASPAADSESTAKETVAKDEEPKKDFCRPSTFELRIHIFLTFPYIYTAKIGLLPRQSVSLLEKKKDSADDSDDDDLEYVRSPFDDD